MNYKNLLKGGLALGMVASLAACSSTGTSTSTTEATTATEGTTETGSANYKVGLHFELTGAVADYGTAELKGAQLALKQANEAAGYEKYTGVEYDNKSDATEAVTLATTLAGSGVVGVVGPATSGASAATYQILNDAGVVVLSPSATQTNVTLQNPDDSSSAVYDYVYRVCFEDAYQGAAMAQYAVDELGTSKAVIYADSTSDYAKGLTTAFTEQYEKLGGTVVDTEYYIAGDTDFSAAITKFASMEFDTMYIPGYYNEAGLIIKQAKEAGIDCPVIGPDGFDSESFGELAGADNLNNVFFTTAYTTVDASEDLQAFIDAYKAEFSEEPGMFAALSYDATNVLLQGVEASEANGSSVQEEVGKLNFSGVTGSFTFDAAHTPVKSVLVVELVDGVQSGATEVSPK